MNAEVDKRALEQHLIEKAALVEALKKYAHCRHACENCNCTVEARAALYPYIVREKAVSNGK
jgi:hypothetical protein